MATAIDVNQITAPVHNPTMTPAEAAQGHDTVTMYFENAVTLLVDWGTKVHYPKGVHEVPREWKDHWYLKNHGAYVYNKPVPAGPAKAK